DLARVVPRPVQIERHVDVELSAQLGDLVLVDVDDLEVAHVAPVFREDLVHRSAPSALFVLRATAVARMVFRFVHRVHFAASPQRAPCATSPKRSRSRSSFFRRFTSAGSKMSRPRISRPKSPEAKGNTTCPTSESSRCWTLTARNCPALIPSRRSWPIMPM